MSDTMRKRLERAVCTAATDGFRDTPTCHAADIGMPGRCGACLLMVDAILSVLESPSEGMLAAGVSVDNEIEHEAPSKAVRMIYGSMIAAIKAGA